MIKINHASTLKDRSGTATIDFNLAFDISKMQLNEFLGFEQRLERDLRAWVLSEVDKVIERIRLEGLRGL